MPAPDKELPQSEPEPSPLATWLSRLWYDTAFAVLYVTLSFGFSFRYTGKRRVPREGPVLVVANHTSFLDPPVAAMAIPRRLHALARKTLFRNKFFGALISSLHAIPVDQEGFARQGLQAVLEQLRQGRTVLIFPEGTRSEDGQMNPLKPGVHLLIKRTRAPILPVGIAGAFDAWPLRSPLPSFAPIFLPPQQGTLAVAVGKPIPAEHFDGMSRQDVLDELFVEIKKMRDEAETLRRQ